MIHRITTAILLLVALVAGPIAQTGPPAPVATIPFELVNRHIVIPVSVNGSAPLSFILDTGADPAIIQMSRAKQLGLTLRGQVNSGGAGAGRTAGALVGDATWTLGGLPAFSQPVNMALDLAQLAPAMGQDVDGILGGQFIKEFVV